MRKKQNHNNTRLNDEQFFDVVRSIAALWALMTGKFCPDPAKPEEKLVIDGFALRGDHGVAVKTLKFIGDVKSESNQESARRDAVEVKQALLGLLRKFLGGHIDFFDKELAAALSGVNDFLWREHAYDSQELFAKIKITKWDPELLKRIEKRRKELQDGAMKLHGFTEAEQFAEFITLQNRTLAFMMSICQGMKQIAGKRAAAKITEAAREARQRPETIGKEPAKKVAPAPKAPAFNPALAELLSGVV